MTVRLAWRDLARYRTRSGSALAAISLAVLIAVIICIVAAARYANPLDYTGPNVASNQLIVYTPSGLEGGPVAGTPATVQKTALAIAGLVGSHEVVELLGTSATLLHSGPGSDWNGTIYVATPQLLAAFHIRSSEVSPKADILSMRPGLARVAGMHLVVLAPPTAQGASLCQSAVCSTSSGPYEPRQTGHIDRPVVQELGSLPSGTDAPNTLITVHAIKQFGLTTSCRWLVPPGAADDQPGSAQERPTDGRCARYVRRDQGQCPEHVDAHELGHGLRHRLSFGGPGHVGRVGP